MPHYRYLSTSEDPSIPVRFEQRDGTAVDLSTATWSLKLVNAGTTLLTKVTGVTGYASFQGTAPNNYNCLIVWSTGELATAGLAGCTFSVADKTLLLIPTVGTRELAPFNGPLSMSVE